MKAWRKVTLLLALALVSTCFVAAHPGHDRLANENAINKNNGFVQNGDIVEQMSAELLGAVKERHKRLSDQRRAELETLMALSKMTGKFMNVSRGGRQLDTAKVGRKKRSVFEMNMKNLRKLFRLSGKLGYKGNAAYPVVS